MKRSLNNKITAIFLTILTVLLLIMLAAVQAAANIFAREYINDDVMNTHDSMNSQITDILNEVNYGYTRMTKSLFLPAYGQETSYEGKKQIFLGMLSEASLSPDYVNVFLRLGEDSFMSEESFDEPGKLFLSEITNGNSILYCGEANAEAGYIEIGRRFQSSLLPQEGCIVFYLSIDVLNSICADVKFGEGKTMLINSDYGILGDSESSDVGKTIMETSRYPLENGSIVREDLNGKDSLVAVTSCASNYSLGWYLLSILDYGILTHGYTVLSWILVGIAGVCFLISFIFALRISRATVAPLNELSGKIASVNFETGKGIFHIGGAGDELYELEKNYDEMLSRLYQLMEVNKENMENQRKLEMDALQMQINPHFLYNTLDAIAWLAKIKKQPEIEKPVIDLAKFFRLSLHKGDKFIYIKEETEIIEHFLEIEKVRFPDTISYECTLPDGIGEYKILKLVLQPIVENCIKHGFEGKEELGIISITARSSGEYIEIDVTDNGCGFDVPEDFPFRKPANTRGGYGLYNVNERIRLEYGDDCGLKVSSRKGEGTTVTVIIKKRM